MNQTQINQFSKLLEQGKLKEAGAVLEKIFQGKLSKEDKALAYLDFATVYTKVMAEYNQEYLEELEAAGQQLQQFEQEIKNIGDQVLTETTRKKISEA